MDYKGRRIWIIGASAGIGEALAQMLAGHGAHLILSARNEEALAALAKDCNGSQILPLDLARPKTLAEAVKALSLKGTSLDAIICTAALYDPGRVVDIDPVNAEAMVRVNILGTIDVARRCPSLLRDGGQLVLFGSVAGYIGLPKGQPYSATKAAVNNLAETLAVELAPRVDVRLVCPGFVETRLTERNDFPMPAIVTPDEAAKAVLRGMQKRGFEIHFPRRFTFVMKLVRVLPYVLSLRLIRRLR